MFAANILRSSRTRHRAHGSARKQPSVARVVVVSNVGNLGGGGVVGFRDILLALRRRRPDAELLAVFPQDGDAAATCVQDGFTTQIAWTPWWAFGKWSRHSGFDLHALFGAIPYGIILIPGILQAVVSLRRFRPTMVLTNTMTIPSHAIAAKILGIPHYWIVREFGRDDHRLWFLLGYRRTIRLINRLSSAVICNSRAVEKAILEQDPSTRTHVLYPVVDTPLTKAPQRRPDEAMRAVLVGYFSRAKGQHLAIEAVSLARRAGVDIELTLVGSGNRNPLLKLARRLGVEDLVSIHGPTRDLGPHWAAAHVGLMCSECEAFGRVTVEAMRAGLPVCGTDSGGTPEIIEAGGAGLLSPAGDARALASNLMELEADESLRRRLAARAAQTAHRFDRDRHDDELLTILNL